MTEIWKVHMEAMCYDFHDDDFPEDEEEWLAIDEFYPF